MAKFYYPNFLEPSSACTRLVINETGQQIFVLKVQRKARDTEWAEAVGFDAGK